MVSLFSISPTLPSDCYSKTNSQISFKLDEVVEDINIIKTAAPAVRFLGNGSNVRERASGIAPYVCLL